MKLCLLVITGAIQLAREAQKIYSDQDLPIHQDVVNVRLISRKHVWLQLQEIDVANFSPSDEWINY